VLAKAFIYSMAIDILSIPAISNEPEQVFSGAHHIISWERTQLSAKNIKRTEYLKYWQKSGISEDNAKKISE
jgi:hypothetical protein